VSWLVVLLGLGIAGTGATLGVAVVAASRLELTRWVARRLAGADAAVTLLSRPGDLSAIAGGMQGLGLVLAGVATPLALANAGAGLTLAMELVIGLPVALLTVYFLPRAIGRRWPERVVRRLVPRLRVASTYVGRFVRGRDATERAELSALFRDSTSAGLAREDELEIVTGVMAFADRTVREAMTPRTKLVTMSETASAADLATQVVASGYTRLPVHRGSVDEISGMVHAIDLIKAGPGGTVPVRPVAAVPATRRCADVLLDLKRERRHLAVVLDEFGGTAGIVTMEDLLEELVGEIFDELDEPRPALTTPLPGVLLAEGALPLARVSEHFGVTLASPPRIETVGGYVAWAAGRIPLPGERVVSAGLEWDVIEGTAQRLQRVVVRRALGEGR
jgi:CBS domain containing-hemolysin-like protein